LHVDVVEVARNLSVSHSRDAIVELVDDCCDRVFATESLVVGSLSFDSIYPPQVV